MPVDEDWASTPKIQDMRPTPLLPSTLSPCRWNDIENSQKFQEWSNVGIATGYLLLCLVALVSEYTPLAHP